MVQMNLVRVHFSVVEEGQIAPMLTADQLLHILHLPLFLPLQRTAGKNVLREMGHYIVTC